MAQVDDIVKVVITTVVDDQPSTPGCVFKGYCTVNLIDENNEWQQTSYNLVNDSYQNVPKEERVVGHIGYIRWAKIGGYSGPVWVNQLKIPPMPED